MLKKSDFKKKIAVLLSLVMLGTTVAGNWVPADAAGDGSVSGVESSVTLGDGDYQFLTLPSDVIHSEYVAMEATIKATGGFTNGWENVFMMGIQNGANAYNFEFMFGNYGTDTPNNIVKVAKSLTEEQRTYEGDENIPVDQQINMTAMENIFKDSGLPVKMIRMKRMVYLQANLDGAWRIIGRMPLPEGTTTEIVLSNWKAPCDFTNIKVVSGKEAVLDAFNGADLEWGNWYETRYFPIQESHWMIEGKIVDTNKSSTDEKRLMTVGQISVLYRHDWGENWFTQLTKDDWAAMEMNPELKAAIAADGLYVRYIRNGDKLRTFLSANGTKWIAGSSTAGLGTDAGDIKFECYNAERLEGMKILIGDKIKSDVSLNDGEYQWFAGRGPEEADYNYAAVTATVKSQVSLDGTWDRNITLGIGGGEPMRGFQLLYGDTSGINLVQVNQEDRTYEGDTAPQNQDVNSLAMEDIFAYEGLQIKMIRMDRMAYLQANLEGQWKLIGRLPLPEGTRTDIAFTNWKTPCDILNINVQWGKEAAIAAFNGAAFEQAGDGWTEMRYFPLQETNWVLEGKVVDTNKEATGEKRLMTLGDISVLHQAANEENKTPAHWCVQQMNVWTENWFNDDLSNAIGGDGVYARFVREGDSLHVVLSVDGENWVQGLTQTGLGADANAVLLRTFAQCQIQDMQFTIGSDIDVLLKGDFNFTGQPDAVDLVKMIKKTKNIETKATFTDINGDGVVDENDVKTIKRYLLGLGMERPTTFTSPVKAGDTTYNTNLFYRNKVSTVAGDPQVIQITDKRSSDYGWYYMYATNATTSFIGYKSKDLQNWESVGTVYQPADNAFGNTDLWAPEVIYDANTDKYYMYYSAVITETMDSSLPYRQRNSMTIGVLSADEPYGPFVAKDPTTDLFDDAEIYKVLGDTGERFDCIDPSPFIDPKDGQLYLLFARRRHPEYHMSIYGIKMIDYMTPDYSSVVQLTEAGKTTVGGDTAVYETTKVVHTTGAIINEAPFMYTYQDENGAQKYILTLSVGSTRENSYSVIQAVGDSPLGTFTKLTEEEGGVLLSYDDGRIDNVSGTGHHSFLQVGSELCIVYHQHETPYPVLEGSEYPKRVIAFDRVVLTENGKGQKVLYTNGPTKALMPQWEALTDYKNIAPEANISVTAGNHVGALTDKMYSIYKNNTFVKEYETDKAATITMKFEDYREIGAFMIYNSKDAAKAFTKISKIELEYFDDVNNSVGVTTLSNLEFDFEEFKNGAGELRPAGSAVAQLDKSLKVKTIRIYLDDAAALSEIVVLGK